jgi:hypothetical protein
VRRAEVARNAAAAGRIRTAKLEQGIDIAGFGIRKPAPDQELCTLLTDGTHENPLFPR